MQKLMVRSPDGDRFLPPIGPELYSSIRTAEREKATPGARLLALSDGASLTSWQRLTGWLCPDKQVARILLLHRLAFEAEVKGRWRRADFLWREAFAQLRRLWTRTELWEGVRVALGDATCESADALRDRVAAELFIDTHIAFANGRFAQATPLPLCERAFAHLAFIRELLQLYRLPPDEAAALLAPGAEAEFGALESAKRWDEAISRAAQYVAASPGDFGMQNRLALLHFKRAVDRLSGKNEGSELKDASLISATIEQVEQMRRASPNNTLLYDLLGQLYHLRSIKLANGGRLADALVAARKAQVFAPALEAADRAMSQLIDNMTGLQKQMREAEAQLSQSSGVSLNEQGRRLQAEARRGFGPLEQYAKSNEPERVATARRLAHAHKLWRDIGITQETAPPDDGALALLDAVSELYGSEIASPEDLAAAFRERVALNLALVGVEADQIAEFILKRRRENSGEGVGAEEEVAPASSASSQPVVASSIGAPDRATSHDLEPLGYWLFGTQDRGTRVLAAAAGAVLLAVLGTTVLDARGSRARAQAYQAITAAFAQDDEKTVLAEAQRFWANWTLRASDAREARVRELQRDALEAPNRRIRDAAVEQLRQALQDGDSEAALAAAERFLSAPPSQVVDPRKDAVLDAYAREFSHWFANLVEPFDEPARARIASYRTLASATNLTERKP